jgi:hypothetical protein
VRQPSHRSAVVLSTSIAVGIIVGIVVAATLVTTVLWLALRSPPSTRNTAKFEEMEALLVKAVPDVSFHTQREHGEYLVQSRALGSAVYMSWSSTGYDPASEPDSFTWKNFSFSKREFKRPDGGNHLFEKVRAALGVSPP